MLDIVNNHYLCPFHYIYIDHQHVSEQGHTRFRTGSPIQVHMSEPGLLLRVNYHEKDRYMALFDAKFLADIILTYHTIVKWRCLLTYWPLLRSKKQNIHNWINVTFRNQVHNSSSNRHHRVSSPSVSQIIADAGFRQYIAMSFHGNAANFTNMHNVFNCTKGIYFWRTIL